MHIIPKEAKKVFLGVIFEVWQWRQKMFDGTFQTFERLKRPDTVVVFPVTEDKKIIVLEQEQPGKGPYLGGAAGRVEEGESIIDAARRELLEETGYEAKELVELKKFSPIDKIEWNVHLFVGKSCKKIAEPNLDPGEKISLKLVSFKDFTEIVVQEDFYDRELSLEILRAKVDPKQMAKLRKIFLD